MSDMVKWDYVHSLMRLPEICDEFKSDSVADFFTQSLPFGAKNVTDFPTERLFCYFPKYREALVPLQRCISISDVLGIDHLENRKNDLEVVSQQLGRHEFVDQRSKFEQQVDFVKKIFLQVQNEVKEALSGISDEEALRLNESIHDFFEGCNYSAVAMSASAIEDRLLALMKLKTPSEDFERATLGEMIYKALNDERYEKLIPNKHKPLLELCNTYRVFSVHAKKEKIGKQQATSVLNLTFSFLLDKSMSRAVKYP